MAPFLLLPLGLLVLNLFFSENPGQPPLFQFLFVEVTPHSVYRAGVLAGRSLALIVLSVGYLLVADPLDLVNSLMQQAGLSPRIGFSVYVAWNTIPSLRSNLDRIQKVHRVRLKSKRRGFREALATPVSLLAGAIRHAQRAALSMHARGLDAADRRTFLRESVWRRRDTIYLVVVALITVATTLTLVATDLFVFGLG
jgi:energy-coupling factor transport system permease protein